MSNPSWSQFEEMKFPTEPPSDRIWPIYKYGSILRSDYPLKYVNIFAPEKKKQDTNLF